MMDVDKRIANYNNFRRTALETPDFIDWSYVSSTDVLSTFKDISQWEDEFVEAVADYIDWDTVSFNKYLPIDFIKKYSHRLNVKNFASSHTITSEILSALLICDDADDWLSRRNLLMRYVSELCDDIDILSHWKDHIKWGKFSRYAEVTLEMADTFADKIKWNKLSKNDNVSIDVYRKYPHRFDWKAVCRNKVMSTEFFIEFHQCFPPDTEVTVITPLSV